MDRSRIQPRGVELGAACDRFEPAPWPSRGPGRRHRGRKFAVLRNASKNIATLCLRVTVRALSLCAGRRVGSGGRAWLCGLAGVRRRSPFRFRSDSRNGETELPWGRFGGSGWGQASGCWQTAGVWVNSRLKQRTHSARACVQQVAAAPLLLPWLQKLSRLGRRLLGSSHPLCFTPHQWCLSLSGSFNAHSSHTR